MPKLPETPKAEIHEFNESELVALCHWNGIKASRAWPRWLLELSLKQFVDYEIPDPFQSRREKMSQWLQKYWERVRMQMRKKVCPQCENCRDPQILVCYELNRKNIEGR